MERLKSGFLLKEILDRFLNRTLSLMEDELKRNSGHDITNASPIRDTIITSIINMDNAQLHLLPYASSPMFELDESRDDHYSKLFYRNIRLQSIQHNRIYRTVE